MTYSANHQMQDPWLQGLHWFVRHFGLHYPARSLVAGLPLDSGQLTPALLVRAADRARLKACWKCLALGELDAETLPCLALTHQGEPMILVSRQGDSFEVLDKGRPLSLDLADLQSRLTGDVCLVSLPYRFEQRTEEWLPESKSSRHWLIKGILTVKPLYRDVLLASFVANLLMLAVPLFTMNVYDRVVPNMAFDSLWVLFSGVIIAIGFDGLLRLMRARVVDVAGKQIDRRLSADLFARVLGIRMEHMPQSVGAFARQLQDFDSVRDFLTSATITALVDMPFAILFVIVVAFIAGPLVLIPLAVLFLILLAVWLAVPKMQALVEEGSRLSTHRNAQTIEALSGLETIKQQNAQGRIQQAWEANLAALSDWGLRYRWLSGGLNQLISGSQQLVTAGLIVAGVYMISANALTMGGMIAIVMLSSRAISILNQSAMLMLRYHQTKTALKSVDTLMSLPQEAERGVPVDRPQLHGAICLDNVSFAYGEQPPALVQVSLNIKPGEKVAIVGPVGSGKSTLLRLLQGLYAPVEGRVLFDNLPMQQWEMAQLRDQLGAQSQDVRLMYGSIRDNIAGHERPVSDAAMERAVALSGVGQFIDRIEGGLDRQVGEGGLFLSGGQRQAIALARALVHEPSVLLLDEPTSSMDPALEQHVMRSLQSLEGVTLVLATHKAELLKRVDRVIVLNHGRLVGDKPANEALSTGVRSSAGGQKVRVTTGTIKPREAAHVSA
jgi:type I secretion system LssB family ATPase